MRKISFVLFLFLILMTACSKDEAVDNIELPAVTSTLIPTSIQATMIPMETGTPIPTSIPIPTNTPTPILSEKVRVSACGGLLEAAYVEYNSIKGVSEYNIYIEGERYTDKTLLDYRVAYTRIMDDDIVRTDLIGLSKGLYEVSIVPVVNGQEVFESVAEIKVEVEEYDRSGYAHFNYTEGVGAYNDDGTLKDNAIVIYLTDDNKETIMAETSELQAGMFTVPGREIEAKGIGWWLNSMQYTSSASSTYDSTKKVCELGFAAVNEQSPIVIRVVGTVSGPEGLTAWNSRDLGGSVSDNGGMAHMRNPRNMTIEGVGFDATIKGWGIHFCCDDTSGEYGKNLEVRNLTFTEYPEDALGADGKQVGDVLVAPISHVWMHHISFLRGYCATPSSDGNGAGDGACDLKKGTNFTMSYCYFERCDKCGLVGGGDNERQYNISFHHNIWYKCAQRMPLLRQANLHFYNNYIYHDLKDETAKSYYITSLRANCYMYAENNYYEGCKNIFHRSTTVGVAKCYGNIYDSCSDKKTYAESIVTDRTASVSASECCNYNGVSYQNFDTNPELFYYDEVNQVSDCYLTDATTAKENCLDQSGSYYRTILGKTEF